MQNHAFKTTQVFGRNKINLKTILGSQECGVAMETRLFITSRGLYHLGWPHVAWWLTEKKSKWNYICLAVSSSGAQSGSGTSWTVFGKYSLTNTVLSVGRNDAGKSSYTTQRNLVSLNIGPEHSNCIWVDQRYSIFCEILQFQNDFHSKMNSGYRGWR